MNAALDLLRIRGKKPFFTTKLALFLAGILLISTIAWFILPLIFGLISSKIPSLSTSLRSSSAPPYLFIAVNFIILTIWKLSQNRTFHTDRITEEKSLFDTDEIISLPTPDLVVSSQNSHLFPKIPLEEETSITPVSESSCITTVSEEKSTASSNALLVQESALTARSPERKEDPTVEVERVEIVSLDAAWTAISEKSVRWESNDVQKQRFDDFIKKNYDQIRSRKPGIKIGASSIE